MNFQFESNATKIITNPVHSALGKISKNQPSLDALLLFVEDAVVTSAFSQETKHNS